MDKKNAFKILNIDETASFEEAKTAYRDLAKKYHPDRASVQTELSTGNDGCSSTRQSRMQDINLAFSCLAPYLLKKKQAGQEVNRSDRENHEQEKTETDENNSDKKDQTSVFSTFFDSIKKFAKARSAESIKKESPARTSSTDVEKEATRPAPSHASFSDVFQKVHPKSGTIRASNGRKKRIRTISKRSPYQGYQTYMALKKKIRFARKRANDSMAIQKVERITPVQPVDPVSQK